MTTFDTIKAAAEAHVAQWPQYLGHFDDYVLVTVRREIRTKMGVAFAKDEIAIAKPAAGSDFRTVWSARNGVDTSVRTADVKDLPPLPKQRDREWNPPIFWA